MSVKKVLTPKQSIPVEKKSLPQYTPGNDEIEKVEKINTGLPADHPVRKLFAEGKLPEQKKAVKKVVSTAKKVSAVMPEAKKTVEKNVITPVKKEVVTKEKKVRVGEYPFITALILEKKYSDSEMMEKVKNEFPSCSDEKQVLKAISACRYFMNAGKRKCFTPDKDGSNKIEQLYRIDGKLIPQSKKEKKSTVKKVDPDNDPLAKIAGIGPNVQKKIVVKSKSKSK